MGALCRQAATLNTNTRYLYAPIVDYAERLIATLPSGLDAVMFTCTGSEANDLAWRLATNFTGAGGAITTRNAYHGNTTLLDRIDGSSIKANREAPAWWVTVPAPLDAGDLDPDRGSRSYSEHFDAAISTLAERGERPAAFFVESFFCTDGVRLPHSGYMADAVGSLRVLAPW